jgi:sRNA-binding carbon storage regulator CsrA
MLILSRRAGQWIQIEPPGGDVLTLTVADVAAGWARLAFAAPCGFTITSRNHVSEIRSPRATAILRLRRDDRITIESPAGDALEILLIRLPGHWASLGFAAPLTWRVYRGELLAPELLGAAATRNSGGRIDP